MLPTGARSESVDFWSQRSMRSSSQTLSHAPRFTPSVSGRPESDGAWRSASALISMLTAWGLSWPTAKCSGRMRWSSDSCSVLARWSSSARIAARLPRRAVRHSAVPRSSRPSLPSSARSSDACSRTQALMPSALSSFAALLSARCSCVSSSCTRCAAFVESVVPTDSDASSSRPSAEGSHAPGPASSSRPKPVRRSSAVGTFGPLKPRFSLVFAGLWRFPPRRCVLMATCKRRLPLPGAARKSLLPCTVPRQRPCARGEAAPLHLGAAG